MMGKRISGILLFWMLHTFCRSMASADPYEPRIPEKIDEWPYGKEFSRLWDQADILGASTYSNPASLHGLLRKLSAGEPVKVVAFGSSITSDCGGCWGEVDTVGKYVPSVSNVYLSPKCQQQQNGWLTWFMTVINTYWPHPDHVLINNGWPGATGTSFAFGTCIEEHLPREADLIIFEQLVALMLSKGNMDVDHLIWRLRWISQSEDILHCMLNISLCDEVPTCNLPSTFMELHFHGDEIQWQEDFLNGLAAYYGMAASFSVRDWYHSSFLGGVPKRKGLSNCQFLSHMFMDVIHPTETGRLLIADWLTNMMISAEQSLFLASDSEPGGGGGDDDNDDAVHSKKFPSVALAPGADNLYSMRCYGMTTQHESNASFSQLPVQEGSHGWQFVEYQVHGEHKKYKPGWVALAPGSCLIVKVDTEYPGTSPELNVTLGVSYLRSYEHMGQANISCHSGCQCEGVILDGNWNLTRTSQIHLHEMQMTQHRECVMQIEVLPITYSPNGGHKFKISQMMTKAQISLGNSTRSLSNRTKTRLTRVL